MPLLIGRRHPFLYGRKKLLNYTKRKTEFNDFSSEIVMKIRIFTIDRVRPLATNNIVHRDTSTDCDEPGVNKYFPVMFRLNGSVRIGIVVVNLFVLRAQVIRRKYRKRVYATVYAITN